jgi:cephalosporin hydroxylase
MTDDKCAMLIGMTREEAIHFADSILRTKRHLKKNSDLGTVGKYWVELTDGVITDAYYYVEKMTVTTLETYVEAMEEAKREHEMVYGHDEEVCNEEVLRNYKDAKAYEKMHKEYDFEWDY